MRRMTRYVLTELTQVFVLCLVALTGLFILVGVVREAISQGLPPAQVVQILPYILPDMLRCTIPVAHLAGDDSRLFADVGRE